MKFKPIKITLNSIKSNLYYQTKWLLVIWISLTQFLLIEKLFELPLILTSLTKLLLITSIVFSLLCTFIDTSEPLLTRENEEEEIDFRMLVAETENSYCFNCEREVSKTSFHCKVCNECVTKLDHHCPWMNNCIGGQNYLAFFTSILSMNIFCWITEYYTVKIFIKMILDYASLFELFNSKLSPLGQSLNQSKLILISTNFYILCLVLVIGNLLLTQLVLFHIFLIYYGLTTREVIKRSNQSEFNQNFDHDQLTWLEKYICFPLIQLQNRIMSFKLN